MPAFPFPWSRLASALVVLVLAGCGGKTKAPPPAADKPHSEADLARVTLSAEAAERMRSEPLQRVPTQAYLPLPGWVAVKQGNEVTLTAPLAGYVRAAAPDKDMPVPGRAVGKGDELFRVERVLPPLEQVQFDALQRSVRAELNKAVESVKVARQEHERVSELKEKGLRGGQDLEQALARLRHAQEDEAAARSKLGLFGDDKGGAPSVTISTPRGGQVLAVHVSPGQYVAVGAPLISLADLSELWLRVPVPESDLPRVARGQPGLVAVTPTRSGPAGKTPPLEAAFLAVVPQVDAARRTADVLYRLPADAAQHGISAKDQLVTVEVPLGERRPEVRVPYAAVVFDAHAGAWVYLDRTPDKAKIHVYERRRVELGPRVANEVVVRRLDWKPGDRVVVHDAAALFSAEFFKPPTPTGQKPAAVDDDD